MKFCIICGSNMTKNTTVGGIEFTCRCQARVIGGPEDTLMTEELMDAGESNLKHEVFIENSPYDPARYIVKKDCPNCKLDFLTMIRVGAAETIMYSCSCGYRSLGSDYKV